MYINGFSYDISLELESSNLQITNSIYFLHKLHGLGKITIRHGCNTPYIARPDKFEHNTSSIQELMLCFNTVAYIIYHILEPMLCFNASLYYSSNIKSLRLEKSSPLLVVYKCSSHLFTTLDMMDNINNCIETQHQLLNTIDNINIPVG